MANLQLPRVVLRLFRERGYAGSSSDLERIRAEMNGWFHMQPKGGGGSKWWSTLGRLKTSVARLRPSVPRNTTLAVLRGCGRAFNQKRLASWRPRAILALGLLGEPFDALEATCRRHRCQSWQLWAAAAAVAEQILLTAPAEPAREDPHSNGGAGPSSSDADTSSSSADSSSEDAFCPSTPRAETMPSPSPTAEGMHSPPSPPPSPSPQRGSSLSAGPGIASSSTTRRTSAQAEEIARVLAASMQSQYPEVILNCRRTAAEVRRAYLRTARLIHPDKCTSPDAARAFQIVGAAYEALQ